jgi:phosphatidylinositol alpha-mannosyltransferase
MEKLLRTMRFDVVHLHEPCTPMVSACAVLRSPPGLPMVGTFHAALRYSPLYRHLNSVAARIIRALTVKIAVSEAAKEYVAREFPGEYRIIPNGVPVEAYAPARQGDPTPGRVVFIGRAEPRKGVIVLLRAFKLVKEKLPEATLVMVGPRWSQVQDLVARADSGLEWPMPGIAALGRVSHEAKLKEMSRGQVMCVPSLEGESFGIVLAEALAAGLPLVASDLPGYRSVLKDGELGELVAVGDHVALAGALCRLLSEPEVRAVRAAKGIEAVEELSWHRVAERVLETYEFAVENCEQRAASAR